MAESSYVNTVVGTAPEELVLEYNDSDRYEFPREDEVPEGCYYSMIMYAERSENKYHDPCFDICYKLLSVKELVAWDANVISTLSYYYVRQRYKIGSDQEREFRCAMQKCGLPKKYKISELIGCTEGIALQYERDDQMGSITQRMPVEIDPTYFTDDELE